jgi:queuosine precursor transporter
MSFKSKYYFVIAILFVAFLMISNTVASKVVLLFGLVLPGSVILFPFTYIFGDILTEIYGYHGSRPIIWAGFGASLLMAVCYWFVQVLPPAPFWGHQAAFESILGQAPRIVIASLLAYIVGEFVNSFTLSRLKVLTKGKYLWTRTVGSTVTGQGADTVIFIIVAFAGAFAGKELLALVLSTYIVKVLVEILMTPLTYIIIGYLKKKEGLDTFDTNISYNPFRG